MNIDSRSQLELLTKYPLMNLTCQQDSEVICKGKIVCQNKIVNISIKHRILDARSHRFQIVVGDKSEENQSLTDIVANCNFKNVIEVLDKVKKYLENENLTNTTDYTLIYRKVLFEYSEFTKFFLNLRNCQLKEDLSCISLSISDEKLREHFLEISVNYTNKFKEIFSITKYDLPRRDSLEDLIQPNHSLTSLFDQFLSQIEYLQPYFNLMDDIDGCCSVLDPNNPKWNDSYRRIWLGENITVIITVDPFNIFKRPDIRFFGPDRLVNDYRTRLNENLGQWNSDVGVFQGILNLLEIGSFPKKPEKGNRIDLLVEYGECSICFCLRLNNQLPEVICKNPSCEKSYHIDCLYEVISLSGRRVYNEISGKCPICEKSITCPIPVTI